MPEHTPWIVGENLFNFNKFRPNAPAITPIVSDQDKDD